MCETEVQVELEEMTVSLCMGGQDVRLDCGLLVVVFFFFGFFLFAVVQQKKMTTDCKYENEINHKKFCPFFPSNFVKC